MTLSGLQRRRAGGQFSRIGAGRSEQTAIGQLKVIVEAPLLQIVGISADAIKRTNFSDERIQSAATFAATCNRRRFPSLVGVDMPAMALGSSAGRAVVAFRVASGMDFFLSSSAARMQKETKEGSTKSFFRCRKCHLFWQRFLQVRHPSLGFDGNHSFAILD